MIKQSRIHLDPAFEEEFRDIEDQVKNYLATLRRGLKERHLKVFMEHLSGEKFFSSYGN